MEISDRESAQAESGAASAFAAGADDAVITKTLSGVVTSWSPGAEQLFGYTAREMIGRSIFRLIPPHMFDEESEIIGKVSRGERIKDYRAVRLTRDGRRIFVSLAVSPLRDEAGQIIGASNIARPLKASSEAEGASLIASFRSEMWANAELRRLAAIVEGSDDAIITITLRGVVTSWNAAAERLFGYSASEMIGELVQRIIPTYLRAEETEIIAKIKRGEAIERYDTIRVGKYGRRITVSLSVTPLRDAAGSIVGATKIARDISLRRQAEDALLAANEGVRIAHDEAEAAIRAKAEALALLSQQARVQAIVDTAVDGIILMDAGGRITLFNPACERIFGYAADQVIGGDVKRLMPPPFRDEHDQYLENYRRTGQRKIIGVGREVMGLRASGEEFPIDLSIGEFKTGEETYFVGVLRDVSERKRTEAQRDRLIEQLKEANALTKTAAQSLARSERFTTMIMDAVPDLIVYWNADLTCRSANRPFCEWHGLSQDCIVGVRMADFVDDAVVHGIQPYVGQALAGVRQQFEIVRTNARGQTRDLLVDFIPDFAGGQVIGFIAKSSDITALKATESALRAEIAGREQANASLRESQIIMQEAQRLGQIGSWEWRKQGNVSIWSDEHYRIFDLDPAAGPPRFSVQARLYGAESWSRVRGAINRALKTKEPYTLTLSFMRANGEKAWLESRGEAVLGKAGEVVGLRGASQDISARKFAEEQRETLIEQLTAANVERAHFARAASHDLREPLRMVSAYNGRLLRGYADRLDAKGAEYLSLSVDAVARMSRILDDLVDFERVGEGARGRWFEAGETIAAALANLEQRILESGATIEVGPAPRIWGNPIRFERLMQNLIGNALKYVAPDVAPHVTLRVDRQGESWRFSISDNGIGIEPRFRMRIFEPFKRLHAGGHYDGTGLGLAICKKIVEGFGGTIWVESNVGAGSTFHFTVKMHDDGEG